MARGRLISKSLGSSRKFHALLNAGGKLGEFCQILFPLVVANTDDFGRMPGDAFTVKNVVLPSSPRVERDFDRALDVMASVGLIERYLVNGDVFIQILQFDPHQPNLHKRSKSLFPENPGDSGISRSVPETPAQSNPELNLTQNPEENPEPRRAHTRKADGLFEVFWQAYPRKKAKEDAQRAWDKRRPDAALLDVMLRALAQQEQSPEWLQDAGKYIPYPATWLNKARWTDVAEFVPRIVRELQYAEYDKWPEECRREHGGTCGNYATHQIVMLKAQEQSA